MTFFKATLAAVAISAISFASAQAAPVYSFESDLANGGSISWDGQATTGVVGVDLPITQVQLNNGGAVSCTDCTLDLNTGIFDQQVGPVTFFNGGGSFTITGDVGNGVETLAMGNVGESTFMDTPSGLDATFSILDMAIVSDYLQTVVFGQPLETGPSFGGFASVSFADVATGRAFASAPNGIAAVDVHLTAVPEPATLTILGGSLLGLGAVARRRRKA